MTHAAVAVDLLQPPDVGGELTAQISFHGQIVLQNLGDLGNLIRSEVLRLDVAVDADLFNDFQRQRRTDAVEVAQRKFNALVARNVNTNDTRPISLSSINVCCTVETSVQP